MLIRPSGTEPLIRVMVEAAEATDARALASELVAALRREAAAAGDDPALTDADRRTPVRAHVLRAGIHEEVNPFPVSWLRNGPPAVPLLA